MTDVRGLVERMAEALEGIYYASPVASERKRSWDLAAEARAWLEANPEGGGMATTNLSYEERVRFERAEWERDHPAGPGSSTVEALQAEADTLRAQVARLLDTLETTQAELDRLRGEK